MKTKLIGDPSYLETTPGYEPLLGLEVGQGKPCDSVPEFHGSVMVIPIFRSGMLVSDTRPYFAEQRRFERTLYRESDGKRILKEYYCWVRTA